MSQSNFMWDRATPGPPFRPAPGVESDQKKIVYLPQLKALIKTKECIRKPHGQD